MDFGSVLLQSVAAVPAVWTVTDVDGDGIGLVWITLVTLLFLAIGFAGFRRRDLAR